jgi:hypothetical protein
MSPLASSADRCLRNSEGDKAPRGVCFCDAGIAIGESAIGAVEALLRLLANRWRQEESFRAESRGWQAIGANPEF